jgi:hypothetical protein
LPKLQRRERAKAEFREEVGLRRKKELNPGKRALQVLIDAFGELLASNDLRSEAASLALAESLWAAVHGVVSLKLEGLLTERSLKMRRRGAAAR